MSLIAPTINVAGIISIIIVILLVTLVTLGLSNEKAKWESVKCEGPKHLYADLIGEDSKKTYKDCNNRESQKQFDEALDPYRERQDNINKNIDDLNIRIETAKNEAGDLTGAVNSNLSSLATSSTTTVSQIRDSLNKLLGAIFLSTKINNGVLNSVQTLNDGDLAKMTNSFNKAVGAINN